MLSSVRPVNSSESLASESCTQSSLIVISWYKDCSPLTIEVHQGPCQVIYNHTYNVPYRKAFFSTLMAPTQSLMVSMATVYIHYLV